MQKWVNTELLKHMSSAWSYPIFCKEKPDKTAFTLILKQDFSNKCLDSGLQTYLRN